MAQLIRTTYLDGLIAALIIDPGETPPDPPLKTTKQALFTNNPPIGPGTVWGDLTEAAYSGYAKSATIVWTAAINEADGSVTNMSPGHLFKLASADPLVTETITGVALVDTSTPPKLLALAVFDEPIPLANVGDGFLSILQLNTGALSDNDQAVQVA